MLGLYPLYRLIAIAWWRWARREIDPMHPDVHKIVHRLRELEAE
jgi:hypothetical protein